MCKKYFEPIYFQKYNIYDIFHSDNNKLIIILPSETKPHIINYISTDNKILFFYLYKCPHNHTYIYSLDIEYNENIKLIINNDIIEASVNKYPIFENKIIFSTIVKDEDMYIKQWIDFHLGIGIDKFIIYDNSDKTTLSEILSTYIENNIVVLIKWIYPYVLPISGISGQTTQQNHSIYAFKNSKYIGLFDIDEYVNIQSKKNINNFFEELIINENINTNKISSFRILNKFFYNPYNLSTDNNNFFKIFNCCNITKSGHEKNFVLPKNVKTFSVHMVTDGLPMYTVNEKYIYFNHYYFLNKQHRGKCITNLIDDTILSHININL